MEDKFFIKKRYIWKKNKNFLGNLLYLSGLKFSNEKAIYRLLLKRKFRYFNHPDVVNIHNNRIILRYVPGKFGLWRHNKLIKDLTFSLVEFNQLIVDRFVLSLHVSSLISNPLISILRGLLNASFDLKSDFKVTSTKNIIKYLKESRTFKTKYLIHRDLGEKHNMFVFDGKIYFFDFESCILTTNFFLVDIVSVSIFREKINSMESFEILDWDIIKMYLNNSDLYRIYDINSLKLQIWLILLRKALHLKQKDNILKRRLLDYLFEKPFEVSILI